MIQIDGREVDSLQDIKDALRILLDHFLDEEIEELLDDILHERHVAAYDDRPTYGPRHPDWKPLSFADADAVLKADYAPVIEEQLKRSMALFFPQTPPVRKTLRTRARRRLRLIRHRVSAAARVLAHGEDSLW